MKHMVSYKLAPDKVAENERLVVAVYESLKEASAPIRDFRYVPFTVQDDLLEFAGRPDNAAVPDEHHRIGMAVPRSTATAVTLFFGEPSMTRSE